MTSTLEESSFPRSAAPELPWVPGPDTSEMEPPSSFSQSGPPALASEWLGSFLVSFWRQKRLHTWSFLPREEPVPCLPVTRRWVALGDVLGEEPHPSGSPGRRAHCFPGADFLAVWVESPEVHVPSGVEGGGGDAHSRPLCILGTKRLHQTLAEERLCHRRCKCGFSVTDFLRVFRNDF